MKRRDCLALAAAALAPAWARADTPWPARPVSIVVPYAPGGNTDLLARSVAQSLGGPWKQTVNVENKPGAGTNIGAAHVARAPADGYTLFLAPIALLAESTLFLVVGAGSDFRRVADLQAASRAGRRLNYGSVGIGSAHHLAGQLLKTRLGLNAEHVPYKGSAPLLQALAADEVQFAFDATALAWVRDGRLRALAVARPQRWPLADDIPSMTEQGVPDFEVGGWFGLMAPAATPPAVVERIASDTATVQASAEFRARLAQLGLAPLSGGPSAMRIHVEREIAKYAQLVRAAGATVD
jgi:tripartite-type tricarboxylate transporter receptor subunit TctC